uniref:Ubiquitin-like domain-containing protein n=1 Tax=Macrostomum lignano TaxID=282301 RepID=A0A1I8FTS2_9PLAT
VKFSLTEAGWAAVGLNCGPKRFPFDPCLVHLDVFTVSPHPLDPNGSLRVNWSVPGIYDCMDKRFPADYRSAIMSIITITVKCDLDNDEIFGRVHVQTTADRTLDWLLDEFCTEKRVKRKETFALRRNAANPELDLAKTIAESGLTDGETIFAYNKNPPPPPPDLPKVPPPALSTWWILAALALAIGAIGLIVLVVVHLTLSRPAVTAYIYAWRSSKYRGNGVVLQKATAHTSLPIQVAGGLSQMREAVSAIVNASKAEAVLSRCSKILRPAAAAASTFSRRRAAGWLAVNFLKGGFGDLPARSGAERRFDAPIRRRICQQPSGASTLATAASRSPSNRAGLAARLADTRPLTVYGRTRRVYAHSFGCYGLGAAQRRAIGRAIADAGYDDGKPVDFPCWQLGTRQRGFVPPCSDGLFTVPAAKVDAASSSPAAATPPAAACWPPGSSTRCAPNQLAPSTNVLPSRPIVGKFVAFSGFYHVADFFNLTANRRAPAGPAQPHRGVHPAGRIDHRASVSEARLRWLCFDGIFVESLLRGLDSTDSNWSNIEFLIRPELTTSWPGAGLHDPAVQQRPTEGLIWASQAEIPIQPEINVTALGIEPGSLAHQSSCATLGYGPRHTDVQPTAQPQLLRGASEGRAVTVQARLIARAPRTEKPQLSSTAKSASLVGELVQADAQAQPETVGVADSEPRSNGDAVGEIVQRVADHDEQAEADWAAQATAWASNKAPR